MRKELQKKQIFLNVAVSVAAQVISLLTSFIINLIVPKFIDEYQYAYWQTYVLYASYAGIFHLGILDGLMLRYSQFDYDELNKSEIKSQAVCVAIILSIFSTIGIVIGCLNAKSVNRTIIILVSLSIIVKNMFVFASYMFQSTNRIKSYARIVITQKLIFAGFALSMVLFGINNFALYCVADLLAEFIGFIASVPANKELYKAKYIGIEKTSKILKQTFLAGSMLMLANLSNNLIIGSSKMFVQNFWDTLSFGKVSFGFSITNLFLTFVTAVSVVLFPSLKRMNQEELPDFYRTLREPLSILLITMLIGYYPIQFILNIWIPKYSDSLVYLGILLPIIICTTRTSLLTNNYFKAYRKEKEMLFINVSSIIVEILGLFIIYWLTQNLIMVLIWTVLLTFAKSIMSEFAIFKIIDRYFYKDIFMEIIMVVMFMFGVQISNRMFGFMTYGIILVFYFFTKRKIIKNWYKQIRGIVEKRRR